MSEPREYCYRCKQVTPSKIQKHATWTEYLCAVCGWQVDIDYDDYDDDEEDDGMEPVGSCENCRTNLYEDDDAELCDQCLWYAMGCPTPGRQRKSEG